MRKAILLASLGIVIGLIVFPIMAVVCFFTILFDKNGEIPIKFSALISWILVAFVPGWKITVEGKENIEKGKSYVIIANHCSMMDIFMVHFLPLNFRWVSKREVLMVPVFGWVLALQRSITINRGDAASAKHMMSEGRRLLGQGVSVAMFPEGTRSKDGQVKDFKAGAFLMASSAEVEILPVMLYGSHDAIYGDGGKIHLQVKILPPVSMAGRKTSAVVKEMEELYKTTLNNKQ